MVPVPPRPRLPGDFVEYYLIGVRYQAGKPWLRGFVPDDLLDRLPVLESEESLVNSVRDTWKGMYDDACRTLFRYLVESGAVRDLTVGETMAVQDVRDAHYSVPHGAKAYDLTRLREVFPEFDRPTAAD